MIAPVNTPTPSSKRNKTMLSHNVEARSLIANHLIRQVSVVGLEVVWCGGGGCSRGLRCLAPALASPFSFSVTFSANLPKGR